MIKLLREVAINEHFLFMDEVIDEKIQASELVVVSMIHGPCKIMLSDRETTSVTTVSGSHFIRIDWEGSDLNRKIVSFTPIH